MSRNGLVRDSVLAFEYPGVQFLLVIMWRILMLTAASYKDPSVPPAIAGILQNLSSRPNVESALVLLRGDGTIICATGNLSRNERDDVVGRPGSTTQATKATSTNATPTEGTGTQEAGLEADGVASQNKRPMSPADTLALAVFSFVHSATLLGRAAGRSHSNQDSQNAAPANLFESVPTQAGDAQHQLEGTESTSKEDQVQLLRLRTKRQEIIIYPDTNYLCCVVQSVGKQANGTA